MKCRKEKEKKYGKPRKKKRKKRVRQKDAINCGGEEELTKKTKKKTKRRSNRVELNGGKRKTNKRQ